MNMQIDFIKLTNKYNTPLYVYDFDKIGEKFLALKNAFKGRKSLIAYALKSNSNLSLLKFLAKLGCGADCVSIGEIRKALMAGIDNYKIIFSGVGKRQEEIEEALEREILFINVESEEEFEEIERIAQKVGKYARISLRINPNVDPKTHPYISTGLKENKFGIEIDTAKKLYLKAKNSKWLEAVGIHFHIGSQMFDLKPIIEAGKIISELTRSLKSAGINIKFFDVGGGIGVRYKDEIEINLYDYAQGILSLLKGLDVTIICEPGRYIVSDAGYFLTKVLYEKRTSSKRFIIVDGAMNDFLRPSLYSAYHKVEILNDQKEYSMADVVGPVCESTDYLAKDRELPRANKGDIVVVYNAGAYGFVMSSNYNARPRAAEVALVGGKDRLIKRRESFEDMIRHEKEFLED
jgi:diaminopimelate decarboxylase